MSCPTFHFGNFGLKSISLWEIEIKFCRCNPTNMTKMEYWWPLSIFNQWIYLRLRSKNVQSSKIYTSPRYTRRSIRRMIARFNTNVDLIAFHILAHTNFWLMGFDSNYTWIRIKDIFYRHVFFHWKVRIDNCNLFTLTL